jgi:phosphoribosylglycinamide formyltransferase-1
MRLAVLVSGRGSNLEAVLEAIASGGLRAVDPVLVVSNRPGVRALAVAERYGVPARVLPRRAFADAGQRDEAIGRAVTDAGSDLVLLAGYDQLLRAGYFAAYRGRTINIHPSLLPRHGGHGMMGLAVHEAVLAAGDAETGVSIHEVTSELDAGPVLAQERVPVRAGEDADALARRVLRVEHRLLVATLRRLALDGWVSGASARMTAVPREERAGGRT